MSDTEDRVRAFLDAQVKRHRAEPIAVALVSRVHHPDGRITNTFAELLAGDLDALLARPSLAELRDVAMTHQRLRYVKGAWLCACGHKLMADGLPVTDQLAAHQLAMMEAAT